MGHQQMNTMPFFKRTCHILPVFPREKYRTFKFRLLGQILVTGTNWSSSSISGILASSPPAAIFCAQVTSAP